MADPRIFVFLVVSVALFLGAIGAGPAAIAVGVVIAALAARVFFPEGARPAEAEPDEEEKTRPEG